MPNAFRALATTTLLSPTFGLPRGTFGRGLNSIEAIVLHTLRCSLEAYDAQESDPFYRNQAEPRHPSMHYAVGAGGEIHRYVTDADIAWSSWDYDMSAFPSPFPAGGWPLLALHPGITPDYYTLNVAIVSGEMAGQQIGPTSTAPVSAPMFRSLTRLLAYLCHIYSLTADDVYIIPHEGIDLQFAGSCPGGDYPYARILAEVQAIIAADGWPIDPLFDLYPFGFDPLEYFGPWTVGVSRVSSAAYISNDNPPDYSRGVEGLYFNGLPYPWQEYDQEFP